MYFSRDTALGALAFYIAHEPKRTLIIRSSNPFCIGSDYEAWHRRPRIVGAFEGLAIGKPDAKTLRSTGDGLDVIRMI